MPCDTISTTNIELGKNIEPPLLIAALKELGLSPREIQNRIYFDGGFYDTQAKSATFTSSRMAGQVASDVNAVSAQVRQAYGKQVAQSYAKKYGWQYVDKGAGKFQLIKATY